MRFNNMNFSDGHYVQIPTSWDAQEFTYRFLSATPPWVRTIMRVRNRVVQKIGFTVQPSSKSKQLEVTVGSSAGPFTFTEVTDEHVIGGHKDRHIEFSSNLWLPLLRAARLRVAGLKHTPSLNRLWGRCT